MRRGLVLACLWVLGVTASVGFAFAAVGRVASRVAPPGVARLSSGAVDRELASSIGSTLPPTTRTPPASSAPSSTSRRSTTTTNASGPRSTGNVAPPPTSGASATSEPPPTPPRPPTTSPHNTVTTSQGGTIWTRCSAADRIEFVAAVPKGGYERTHDLESATGIVQWFENDNHRSKISAACSGGVVHTEVEEESGGDDYEPLPTSPPSSSTG